MPSKIIILRRPSRMESYPKTGVVDMAVGEGDSMFIFGAICNQSMLSASNVREMKMN